LKKACKKAGIVYCRFKEGGFIFHDLRRTFYTEARRAGVPDSVIKEITGHSRNQVTDRYHDVSLENKRHAIEKLTLYRKSSESVAQNVAQEAILRG
jgi:integrase